MPIENERKYVLLPSMEEEFKDRSIYYRVEQGYVQNAAEGFQIRFRKAEHYIGHKKVDTKRIFTLKSKNCDFTSTEIFTPFKARLDRPKPVIDRNILRVLV